MKSLENQVDALFAEWDRPNTPGCVLGIIKGGELVYARGYGMANLDYDIPITPDSVFTIASMSKQFTALSILLLAQRGNLALDDDIRKYVPEIPDYGHTICIRHLIHHTSGIRNETTLMGMANRYLDTNEEVLRLLARQKSLDFQPGDEHVYCNSGYLLLAEIIKRVSGQSLNQFAQEHIFEPLGMANTQFADDYRRVVKNRAISYSRNTDGNFQRYVITDELMGPTGVLTTVGDLYRWNQNFYHYQVGGSELVAQMQTPGRLNSGAELHYACGLAHGAYRGLKIVWHGGLVQGFRSQMIRFPEQNFTAICLANIEGFSPTRLIHQVADIYLADAFTEAKAAFIELPPERLQEVVGVYYDYTAGFNVELLMRGSMMLAEVFGAPIPVAPIRATPDSIVLRELGGPLAMEIEVKQPLRPRSVQAFPDQPWRLNMQVSFHKPPPMFAWAVDAPDADELAEYVGAYTSDELQATYEITVQDGALHVTVGSEPPYPLKPGRGDLFRLAGGVLGFTRNEAGQVAGFTRTEPMARNIYFRKAEFRPDRQDMQGDACHAGRSGAEKLTREGQKHQ